MHNLQMKINKIIDSFLIENSVLFKLLLAFAAGSLLGDIFFHLLPEASGLKKITTHTFFIILDKKFKKIKRRRSYNVKKWKIYCHGIYAIFMHRKNNRHNTRRTCSRNTQFDCKLIR